MRLHRNVVTERLLTGCTVLLTLGAIVAVAWRVHVAKRATPPVPAVEIVANWLSYARAGVRVGSEDAPVTVVEFLDFRCPICRRAAPYLAALPRRFADEVAVVYRHYPLDDVSFEAALAAECAKASGSFQVFHDVLYRRSVEIGSAPWTRLATEAGIADTLAFGQCVTRREGDTTVERDMQAARELGVTGTPTFLINDTKVVGFYGEVTMDSLVRSALEQVRAGDSP